MSRRGRYHICTCGERRRTHVEYSGECKECDCKQFKRAEKGENVYE